MSVSRSVCILWTSLIYLLLPSQLLAQDNATIAQELATELVDSVTRSMTMMVIGPVDSQSLALTELGPNKFLVTVKEATFLDQPLPEIEFTAQKALGGLWVISQGKTNAPISIKTEEGGLEVSIKDLAWRGTWDSKNSEYIAISVTMNELKVKHPKVDLSIAHLKHNVGDRDAMTGEFITGLYFTDLAYKLSSSGTLLDFAKTAGFPYEFEGKMPFFQDSIVLITTPDYRPFRWLSAVQDAVRERKAMANDNDVRLSQLKAVVGAVFQNLSNFGGHIAAEEIVTRERDNDGQTESSLGYLSTQLTGWHDEGGKFRIGADSQKENYSLIFPTGFDDRNISLSFNESLSSLSLESYDAGGLEQNLLALIDRSTQQEMAWPNFDETISFLSQLGGLIFIDQASSAKIQIPGLTPIFNAETLSLDLKFAALGEPDGRVGTGITFAATGAALEAKDLSPLGQVLQPKVVRLALGSAHYPLDKYKPDSEKSTDFGLSFPRLWQQLSPTVFGHAEWSNDDLVLSARLKGDFEFTTVEDKPLLLRPVGSLEIAVLGLDALKASLDGLDQADLDADSREWLFWLRAGLGMLKSYSKPDENDSSRFEIFFGGEGGLSVNEKIIPLEVIEMFHG